MSQHNKTATMGLDTTNDDDHDGQCPVCLNPCENLVMGPCHHATCLECMRVILNANGESIRWPPQSAADVHLSAPTLGRCPICRSELSLFDLVEKGGEIIYPKNTDYWKEEDSPLRNAVYYPYHGRMGQLSFHWDWEKLRHPAKELPFLNLCSPVDKRSENWRLEDGRMAPRIKHFEPDCHYDAATRTFHGTMLWPERLNGSYAWDIVLGFPKDFRFIATGRIHMRRDLKIQDVDLPEEYTAEQRQLCRYPFDGRWSVSWKNKEGDDKRIEIQVKNSEYVQSGWSFFLNFDDPLHPSIRWPKSTHTQTVQEGVDLTQYPLGPEVGQKVRWTTTSPNFPELEWERQTVGPIPLPHVITFGMGQDNQLYQRLHANMGDAIPRYNGQSLWGNVFCKRLYVGSASYHFLSPTNSYISYQHPACRDLPTMDDGSPLPTRVDFHEMDWNPEERKLTANIEWEEDFGTSWNDNVRWKLTMYFDSEYMIILKGGIQCEWCAERRARPRPPRPTNPHRPPPVAVYVPPEPKEETPPPQPDRNEEWIMSGYGHDQLYINAAMLERFRNGEVSVDYKNLANEQCQRLRQEGATQRSLGFVNHVFELAASKPNSNPIDFLLG